MNEINQTRGQMPDHHAADIADNEVDTESMDYVPRQIDAAIDTLKRALETIANADSGKPVETVFGSFTTHRSEAIGILKLASRVIESAIRALPEEID